MSFAGAFIPMILFLLVMIIIVGIEVLIGVYVYKDANSRGMNGVLWTLIAIFAPYLVGFIIYLLVRGRHSNLNCPQCNNKITEQYVVCPKCGAPLKATCPNCKTPVEQGWKICPQCTETLPENLEHVTPKKPKDNLWKILVAIIAVPVLIILICFICVVGLKESGGASSAMGEIPFDKIADVEHSQYISNWIDTHDENSSTAYVLRHSYTDSDDQKKYVYLIHIPNAGSGGGGGLGIEPGGFSHDILRLDFQTGENKDDCLFYVTCTSDTKLKLNIYLDGTLIDCDVQDIDFSPANEMMEFME